MLDINLKQLEAFVATAEYRSFTKAADAMFLTQSTISSHISTLERTLGVRLVQRGARQRVALTQEGERVYREAKHILSQCQAIQNFGQQHTDSTLSFGAAPVSGQYVVPEYMAAFLNRYPDVTYSQFQSNSMQIHRFLEQGRYHLGFVDAVVNRQICHYHPLAQDRLVIITPNQEPYRHMQAQGVSGRGLLDQPMLLREETSGTRQALDACLSRWGIPQEALQVAARIDDPQALVQSVRQGLGIGAASWLQVREAVQAGQLLAFDLETEAPFRSLYLCWRKDTILTDLEHKFLQFVQGHNLKNNL